MASDFLGELMVFGYNCAMRSEDEIRLSGSSTGSASDNSKQANRELLRFLKLAVGHNKRAPRDTLKTVGDHLLFGYGDEANQLSIVKVNFNTPRKNKNTAEVPVSLIYDAILNSTKPASKLRTEIKDVFLLTAGKKCSVEINSVTPQKDV